MAELQVTTLSGRDTVLNESAVEEFGSSLRGELIAPGDAGYDDARRVWNANVNKRPALVARCQGVADVISSVSFARDNDLLVSVRGGGHNFPGTSICNGGLVIDLSLMRSVRVDLARRTARAEGGAKWLDFDHETQAFGLAATGGTDSDTGIGGLTLGGGIGWLGGKYGLACDNLVSADVVTADGKLRTASFNENPDLFWAVRGGCGNFGVVTSFEYQVYPVGTLLAGLVAYPVAKVREVLRFYQEFASAAPDELNTASALRTLPNGTRVVGIGVCYNGPLDRGERVLKPLLRFGEPLLNSVQPRSYIQVQHLLDGVTPEGNQYYGKSHFIKDITDGAIDALAEHYSGVPSPLSVLVFQQLGNAANRVPQEATAYSHRDARYNLNLIGQWTAPGETEPHVQWVRELWDAVAPYATGGVYVNNVGNEADDGIETIRAAYGANYPRLATVKQMYDPKNLFRHNQNIRPES